MIDTINVRDLILSTDELSTIKAVRRAKREVSVNLAEYTVTHPMGDPTAFEIRRTQGKTSDWSFIVIPKKKYMAIIDNRGKKPDRTIIENGVYVYDGDPVRCMNPIVNRMPEELEVDVPWLRAFRKSLAWRKGFMNFLTDAPEALELCAKGYMNIETILHEDYDGKMWFSRINRWGDMRPITNPASICDYLAKAGPYTERHKAIRGDVTNRELEFVSSMAPVMDALEYYMGQLVSVYMAELCHVTFDVQTIPGTRNGILGDYGRSYNWRNNHPSVDDIDIFKDNLKTLTKFGIRLNSPDIMDYTIKSMIKQGFDTQPFAFFVAWAENLTLQKLNYGYIKDERPDMIISETSRLSLAVRDQLIYIAQSKAENLKDSAKSGVVTVNRFYNNLDNKFDYEVQPIKDNILAEQIISNNFSSITDQVEIAKQKPILLEIKLHSWADERDYYNYCLASVEGTRLAYNVYHASYQDPKPWQFGDGLISGPDGGYYYRESLVKIISHVYKQVYDIEINDVVNG